MLRRNTNDAPGTEIALMLEMLHWIKRYLFESSLDKKKQSDAVSPFLQEHNTEVTG